MRTAAMTLSQAITLKEEQIVLEFRGERLPCFITYGHQMGLGPSWPKEETFALLHVDVHETLAGPIFRPGGIGCPACFAKRRNENLRELERNPEDEGRSETAGNYRIDEALVRECLSLLLRQAGEPGVLDYYRIEAGGDLRRYSFWPAERCKYCAEGEPEDDTAAILQALERHYTFRYGDSYRVQATAVSDIVFAPGNADSNFIIYKDRNTRSFFSLTSFFRIYREEKYELGIGSSTDYRSSELKSRCEALERYAGMHPRGRERLSIQSSARSLQDRVAVADPMMFVDSIAETGCQTAGYHEDLPLNWIPALSWKRQEAMYIPECLAYYKPDRGYDPGPRIYKSNSNGNALGTTLLDSIYYACLELIERDAFLNHWYLRRSPPEIIPASVKNAKIRYMTGRLEALGYTVQLFDITMETGIPVIWVLCLGQTEAQFAAYSTSAAHPNPERAILAALEEMLLALEYYGTHAAEIREKAWRIRNEGVKRVEDHPILYFLQEERVHFDFLAGGGQYDIRERFAGYYGELQDTTIDLAEETSRLLDRITGHYGEAFIVRQTPEGYMALGLEVVKVIVPDMQPLWFGEESRMLCRRRIDQAAQYWKMDSAAAYPVPHPFP
jgi:ribosomal protein S12 methylthiotransferase accessory factor